MAIDTAMLQHLLYLIALDVSLLHELENRQRLVGVLRPNTTGDERVIRHQSWEDTGLVHLVKNLDGLLRGVFTPAEAAATGGCKPDERRTEWMAEQGSLSNKTKDRRYESRLPVSSRAVHVRF